MAPCSSSPHSTSHHDQIVPCCVKNNRLKCAIVYATMPPFTPMHSCMLERPQTHSSGKIWIGLAEPQTKQRSMVGSHAKALRYMDFLSIFQYGIRAGFPAVCISPRGGMHKLYLGEFFHMGPSGEMLWLMKWGFCIPSKEELWRMVTPENVCAYESMHASGHHFKHLGINKLTQPTGLASAMINFQMKKKTSILSFDEQEEEDYEDDNGESQMMGFMFENVDDFSELDVDYLDEDAKGHLSALADKLGLSLTNLDFFVKGRLGTFSDLVEQEDYNNKVEFVEKHLKTQEHFSSFIENEISPMEADKENDNIDISKEVALAIPPEEVNRTTNIAFLVLCKVDRKVVLSFSKLFATRESYKALEKKGFLRYSILSGRDNMLENVDILEEDEGLFLKSSYKGQFEGKSIDLAQVEYGGKIDDSMEEVSIVIMKKSKKEWSERHKTVQLRLRASSQVLWREWKQKNQGIREYTDALLKLEEQQQRQRVAMEMTLKDKIAEYGKEGPRLAVNESSDEVAQRKMEKDDLLKLDKRLEEEVKQRDKLKEEIKSLKHQLLQLSFEVDESRRALDRGGSRQSSTRIDAPMNAFKTHQARHGENGQKATISGLSSLLMILRSSKDEIIWRVVVGAIANLAVNENNQELIMTQGGISLISRTTYEAEDPQTLRMLHPELKRLKLRKNEWDSDTYQLDEILTEFASQKYVYEVVAKPVVESVLEGYNGTMMAYGQTGIGKTFTLGQIEEEDTSDRGIIVHAMEDILADISPKHDSVTISYLQLYMEIVQDLLVPSNDNISIVEDPKTRDVSVHGATLVEIRDQQSFVDHAILMVNLRRVVRGRHDRELVLLKENGNSAHLLKGLHAPIVRKSKLVVVDLASSKQIDKSRSEGHALEEAKSINLSLSVLGKHCKDFIGCDSWTVSPTSRRDCKHTIMFGQRAMKVKNMVKLKEEFDYKSLCRRLEIQLEKFS
eukprot:Gb_21131 [translate_table: standard]